MSLTSYEMETIINFNKGDDTADIFTYEKTWQQHIEKRFGVKPILDNDRGGKSYRIPKSRIRKPVPTKVFSPEKLDAMRKRAAKMGRG